jgi:hypothetical protein
LSWVLPFPLRHSTVVRGFRAATAASAPRKSAGWGRARHGSLEKVRGHQVPQRLLRYIPRRQLPGRPAPHPRLGTHAPAGSPVVAPAFPLRKYVGSTRRHASPGRPLASSLEMNMAGSSEAARPEPGSCARPATQAGGQVMWLIILSRSPAVGQIHLQTCSGSQRNRVARRTELSAAVVLDSPD